MALIDLFLARAIKRGQLTLTTADGKTRSFGTPDPELKAVAIRFTDRGVGAAIARDPALGAGEAFMDGRLVIEKGTILDLVALVAANGRLEDGVPPAHQTTGAQRLLARVRHRLATHIERRRSKANVAHHYDLSAELYSLFLDADRQYSCAYWTDPERETLDEAQLAKKAHIVAKLQITPGMRVLDIGCGWGGMALYIYEKTGAEVLGITLSEEQLKAARARAEAAGVADKVRFELIDYRDVSGPFDRIVSVGMFEHVGRGDYRAYLAACRRLLTPDGVALIHTIGRANRPGVTDSFTLKYIFPGGYTPALSEIMTANDGLQWLLTDVEVLRLHYAYTLKAWYDRCVERKAEIVALYDERFFRMWTFYLAASWSSFVWGELINFQLQFTRSRHVLPITRDYMGEAERRLLGR